MCHRALKACAEVMGIKDLYCKVEANTKNYQAIVRAFFDALVHQVTHFTKFDVQNGVHLLVKEAFGFFYPDDVFAQ